MDPRKSHSKFDLVTRPGKITFVDRFTNRISILGVFFRIREVDESWQAKKILLLSDALCSQ